MKQQTSSSSYTCCATLAISSISWIDGILCLLFVLGPLDCSWGVRGPLAQTIPGRLGLDQNQIQVGFKQLTKSNFEQHGRVRNRCETVGVERNCPCRIMSDLAHTRVCASLVSSLVFGAVFAYQTAHGRPAGRTTPNTSGPPIHRQTPSTRPAAHSPRH